MNDITILWLDDMRDPKKYFNKKSTSGAFIRNSEYYNNNIFGNYNPNFIWVRNFEEFTDYIMNNHMPDLVSFDHDLGKGLKKGLDCANWLIQYCKQTNQKMPKCFVHSANPNGQREINGVLNNNIFESTKDMKKKNVLKINESSLRKMIKESIVSILLDNPTICGNLVKNDTKII